jgi:hypothetical protein
VVSLSLYRPLSSLSLSFCIIVFRTLFPDLSTIPLLLIYSSPSIYAGLVSLLERMREDLGSLAEGKKEVEKSELARLYNELSYATRVVASEGLRKIVDRHDSQTTVSGVHTSSSSHRDVML